MALRVPRPDDATEGPIWEKRADETPKAFAAFRAYLTLGGERSTYTTSAKLGRSHAMMKHWSRHHNWVNRAQAWDLHVGRIEQSRQDKVRAEYAEKWERRRQEAAEANWGLASSLRDKVVAMLSGMADGGPTLTLTTANLARLAKLTAMMMSLQAASVAEGRGVADDDGFNPLTATQDELKAYLASKGVKVESGAE